MNVIKIILSAMFLLFVNFSHAQYTDEELDAYPPDFGVGKTHLVIVTIPGYFQVNNALKKTFEKYYTGSYEIIKITDTEGRKHNQPDTKYYGFNVYYDRQEGQFIGSDNTRISPTVNYSFGMTDFASSKEYKLSFYAGTYNKLMKAYIQKLEQVRKSNEAE